MFVRSAKTLRSFETDFNNTNVQYCKPVKITNVDSEEFIGNVYYSIGLKNED